MELLQRKMRLYQTTKRPLTKLPKLLDPKYNAEKIKRITSGSFETTLASYADAKKRIILAVVDEGYSSFALNFYKLSIQRQKLTNFLFIALDKASADLFKQNDLPFWKFPFLEFLKKPSRKGNFGSSNFNYKTNMKTAVMIQALSADFKVLMVDVDVIFFKDPLPFLHCHNCSLLVQQDRFLYNSGFVFAKSTPYSRQVYELAWNFFLKFQKSHDQSYFNMAIRHLKDKKKMFELQVLPKEQFPCGLFYFENVHRPFGNRPSCLDCVLVHNNYMGSKPAKLYRQKEALMWVVDQDGYYSNTSAKYLTYENPFEFEDTQNVELETLKSAMILATKLKRLLILPAFHCCSCSLRKHCSYYTHRCSLLSVLRVSSFDRTFERQYREHSFLNNPLVPSNVKNSASPLILVNSSIYEHHAMNSSKLLLYPSHNLTHQPSLNDVSQWLQQYHHYSILNFHSLYNTKFHERVADDDFKIRHVLLTMKNAFECAEYEQWEKDVLKFK